jgi:hypothetical protein
MNPADERRIEMLWTVLQVGRVDLVIEGWPKCYRVSVPRVKADLRRVRAALSSATGGPESGDVFLMGKLRVLLCLN